MTEGRSWLTVAPVGVLLSAEPEEELARPPAAELSPATAVEEAARPSRSDDEADEVDEMRVEGAAMMSCVCEGIQMLSSVEAENEAEEEGAAAEEPRAPLTDADAEATDDEAAGMAHESNAEADPNADGRGDPDGIEAEKLEPLAVDAVANDDKA